MQNKISHIYLGVVESFWGLTNAREFFSNWFDPLPTSKNVIFGSGKIRIPVKTGKLSSLD